MARKFLVGIDEVGRGPLAGPVTVCAFALKEGTSAALRPFLSFTKKGRMHDSKTLSAQAREQCVKKVRTARQAGLVDFSVSHVSARVIDRIGIVPAVHRALGRALRRLEMVPERTRVFLDGGLKAPTAYTFQETVIRGDQTIPIISLASIVAKVARDRKMRRLAKRYPGYGFEEHVGYGTAAHYRALRRLGYSDIHRRSFLSGLKLQKYENRV